jgi:murein L,D-transpeptidase YcbB/YkuD
MRTALLLISMVAFADSAADVLNVFSAAAEALTNDDSAAFLEHFDRSMPDYAALRGNIEGLLAAYEVGSTIEVVTDEGNDEKRMVSLDWLLVTSDKNAVNGNQQTRRRIVKCTLERQGKRWRITALTPIDFFQN